MALTAANGPFSRQPIGRFNIEIDRSTAVLFWEPVPQRVRAIVADETVADSTRMMLLHETGHLPVYYFPEDDVRADLLERSSRTTECPHKGSARYWPVRVGDRLVDDLVWSYPDPQHDGEPVRDLFCFFNERVDLELDGEIQQRPRTQYSRDDE